LKRFSISLRLTFWFSAIFLSGFLLFGIIMWADLAYSLSKGRDRTLARRAARFHDLLRATRNDPPARRAHKFEELAEVIPEGSLIRVYDPKGHRLFPVIPNQEDFPWPRSLAAQEQYSAAWFGGRQFRVFTQPLNIGTEPVVIVVAGQLEDNRNMMARFTAGLAWTIPIMWAISGFGGYFLSRRVLRPVDQITTALRTISIGSLSRRLPISNSGDELQRLAETCNDMLARLQDAVDRINRFTADASHELRSPVALVRTVAEYALRNPRIDGDSREAFEEILAETVEAGALLEDMLTLARADAGYADVVFEPVEIGELVEDVCTKLQPLAKAKNQVLAVRLDEASRIPTPILGDRSSLRRLLSILLDNAIKYTHEHGNIEVQLKSAEGRAVLTVKDNGMGIPESLLPRIFDRFVRADPSRGEVTGTGLGLAIAKWIANAHQADLSVVSRPSHGSVFALEFHLLDTSRFPATAHPMERLREA
jgi:heavy metal sensor kinase